MAISWHKTRAIFDRYNIVNDRDLADAAQRMNRYLAQKTVTATVTEAVEEDDKCEARDARKLIHGANGEGRTPIPLREPDPKSGASANSATFAWGSFYPIISFHDQALPRVTAA